MQPRFVIKSVLSLSIAAAVSWFTYRALQRKINKAIASQSPDETKWQHIGQLEEINFYPVKSGTAVELEEADCSESGITWKGIRDRCLVLLNAKDELVYAGVYPRMLGIHSTIIGDKVISVEAPDLGSLTLNLNKLIEEGTVREIAKKGYRMQLAECKAEHHVWFSRAVLQKESGVRLFIVFGTILETSWWRTVEPEIFPIMVLHNKSVQDLNSRLLPHNQVHHQQFRGNLIIDSNDSVKAYDEDNWMWLKISNDANRKIILRFNSDCMRCILVNVNVPTCRRNADFEPLRTLKKYRLRSHPLEPVMGRYFDVLHNDNIKKGDPVYVQYK